MFLLNVIKFLRLVGLFPRKIRSRHHHSLHLVCRPHAVEGRKASHIGSFSPLILSATIVYQLLSVLFSVLIVVELTTAPQSDDVISVDMLGNAIWEFVSFFSTSVVSFALIINNNKLAALCNSLIQIFGKFENEIRDLHPNRCFRSYIYISIFIVRHTNFVFYVYILSYSFSYNILWLRSIYVSLTFSVLVEAVFWNISLVYRIIVSENGKLIFEEKGNLENQENIPITTIICFNQRDCPKCNSTIEETSLTSTVALQTEMLIIQVTELVELASKVFEHAALIKIIESSLSITANSYFIVRNFSMNVTSPWLLFLFLLCECVNISMLSTVTESINNEVSFR